MVQAFSGVARLTRRVGTLVVSTSIMAAALFLFALPPKSLAQAREKTARIGILFIGSRDQPHLEAFKQGLRERGYVEGKNINLVYRYAEGRQDRLGELAVELVREQVDLIVTTASISAQAVRKATTVIPIVMTTGNPLEIGLAASLAKPGGNVTGLTVMLSDLSSKRIELLQEAIPRSVRVAVLWSPRYSEAVIGYEETRKAAKALSLTLHPVELQKPDDIERAFVEISKVHAGALVVILSPLVTLNSERIVKLALNYHLPGMYPTRQFAEEGGLMAYGPSIGDMYRRAATYVDKILHGARAADLPIEQPTKFELIINLRAAKQIGITVPPNVLARADTVMR